MEDTSCKEKCPWVKSGFCQHVEECPNHVESWWTEGATGQQKLVRDCVPKRLMIQMAMLQSRFEGVQAATEQVRNETTAMNGHFASLVDASNKFIEEQERKSIAQDVNIRIEQKD